MNAYDGMAEAIDETGEDWEGIDAENGACAHVTVYGGAVLMHAHDPDAGVSTVIRLSANDALMLAESLANAAGDPRVTDDAETRGGWRP